MDTGAQVASITNIQTLSSNFSLTETIGILREKVYNTNDQLCKPGDANTFCSGLSSAFGSYFPGVTIVDILGDYGGGLGLSQQSLSIGPSAADQGPYTGVFQNRIEPSANAIWTKGKHTLPSAGAGITRN